MTFFFGVAIKVTTEVLLDWEPKLNLKTQAVPLS